MYDALDLIETAPVIPESIQQKIHKKRHCNRGVLEFPSWTPILSSNISLQHMSVPILRIF